MSIGDWIVAALAVCTLGMFAIYALAMVLYGMQLIVKGTAHVIWKLQRRKSLRRSA